MQIALGQFAVAADPAQNLDAARALIDRAGHADLLVLPEGILARDVAEGVRGTAEPLDGPFVSALAAATRGRGTTVLFCMHVPGPADGRVWNTQVALRGGAVVAAYRKLHLYDAFSVQESATVAPGAELPPVIDVAGWKVGLMTCYDLRFPEVARRLACDGAELLAVPAAWLRGPGKERHWEVLSVARALENTCYLAGAGECGPKNIGASLLVDPLGVIVAQAGASPALLTATLDRARLDDARRQLPVLRNRRFARPELG